MGLISSATICRQCSLCSNATKVAGGPPSPRSHNPAVVSPNPYHDKHQFQLELQNNKNGRSVSATAANHHHKTASSSPSHGSDPLFGGGYRKKSVHLVRAGDSSCGYKQRVDSAARAKIDQLAEERTRNHPGQDSFSTNYFVLSPPPFDPSRSESPDINYLPNSANNNNNNKNIATNKRLKVADLTATSNNYSLASPAPSDNHIVTTTPSTTPGPRIPTSGRSMTSRDQDFWNAIFGLMELNRRKPATPDPTFAAQNSQLAVELNVDQLTVENVRRIFNAIDKDKGGQLTADEIAEGLVALGHEVSPKTVMAVMRSSDSDGNGEIDFREFLRQVIKKQAEH